MHSGALIAERFEIEREAGAGAMGLVYRARDRLTAEPVAVKVMREQDAGAVERFAREARALIELRHPGVVRYVAHGATPEGTLFLAMEWLEGEPLDARLARGPLGPAASVALATRVAGALGAAHARGIVHRDVKPGNLFLVGGRVDAVKVVDFGIARLGAAARSITRAGAIVGTPAYMAPEQARGERVDARADVFALGCVLFECLAGRPAFLGHDVLAVLAKILLEDPPHPGSLQGGVPRLLDALCMEMLAKDPARRPKDGASVESALASMPRVEDEAGATSPSAARTGDFVAETIAAPSSRTIDALSAGERRLVSVIVVRHSDGHAAVQVDSAAPTLDAQADPRAALLDATARFGARLDALVDGSLIATLASAGSATDQAARAARCALSIRALLPDSRMAIATGRAEVRGTLPVGPVIDAASRAAAIPASRDDARGLPVRLDDTTAGLLDARFEVAGDAYGLALSGEREAVDTTRLLLGKPAPFVGRERDLATLIGTFEECVAESEARAVLVIAPPAVGKSRLCHELVKAVEAGLGATQSIQVWLGRGDPVGAGSPFSVIAQAVRRTAGIRDGEPIDVRRQKLLARAKRRLGAADATRAAAFLGEIVGTPFPDEGDLPLRAARADAILMGDQIRRAWEDFLASECAAEPVLLVLDDLHWGDLPSVSLVDSALRVLSDRPWMVLGLARPEVRSLFPDLWAGRGVSHVELRELGRRASEKLVRAVLGEKTPPAAVDRIVTRAAGNALFLEELIRAVAEGRGESMPATIVAMAEARVEAQPPAARRVLRAASVFGDVFSARGVTALLGGDPQPGEIRAELDELVRAELCARLGSSRFQGDLDFGFRHALVREAAYDMLTDADRALGHQLAGAFLEVAGETEAVVLAEHFERAGNAARAAGFYRRAAQQALEGNDYASVIARAAKAAALGAGEESIGELDVLEAIARESQGDNEGSAAAATGAMRRLRAGSAAWYDAATHALIAWQRLDRRDRFNEVLAAVRSAPWDDEARAARIAALATAARNTSFLSDIALGRALLDECAGLAERLGEDEPAAAVLARARGLLMVWDGEPEAYMRFEQQAAATLERTGNHRWACYARLGAADALKELGAFDESERALRKGLAEAERMGLRASVAYGSAYLGLVMGQTGRFDEAITTLRASIVESAAQRTPRLEAVARIYLARTHLAAGDAAAAEHEGRAAARAVGRAHVSLASYALALTARAILDQRRAKDALPIAREAMALLASTDGVEAGEAFIRLVHVEALDACDERGAALAALSTARDLLLARAAKVRDERLREGFLSNVSENARTLALAEAWLSPAASPPPKRG